jgi:hypothetical protein
MNAKSCWELLRRFQHIPADFSRTDFHWVSFIAKFCCAVKKKGTMRPEFSELSRDHKTSVDISKFEANGK